MKKKLLVGYVLIILITLFITVFSFGLPDLENMQSVSFVDIQSENGDNYYLCDLIFLADNTGLVIDENRLYIFNPENEETAEISSSLFVSEINRNHKPKYSQELDSIIFIEDNGGSLNLLIYDLSQGNKEVLISNLTDVAFSISKGTEEFSYLHANRVLYKIDIQSNQITSLFNNVKTYIAKPEKNLLLLGLKKENDEFYDYFDPHNPERGSGIIAISDLDGNNYNELGDDISYCTFYINQDMVFYIKPIDFYRCSLHLAYIDIENYQWSKEDVMTNVSFRTYRYNQFYSNPYTGELSNKAAYRFVPELGLVYAVVLDANEEYATFDAHSGNLVSVDVRTNRRRNVEENVIDFDINYEAGELYVYKNNNDNITFEIITFSTNQSEVIMQFQLTRFNRESIFIPFLGVLLYVNWEGIPSVELMDIYSKRVIFHYERSLLDINTTPPYRLMPQQHLLSSIFTTYDQNHTLLFDYSTGQTTSLPSINVTISPDGTHYAMLMQTDEGFQFEIFTTR